MCEEYIPQIFMIDPQVNKVVDYYFTNGAVRRYDVQPVIDKGGVFAPLANQDIFNRSLCVYEGTLSFDIKGNHDPYALVDICSDIVYAEGIDPHSNIRTFKHSSISS